ncbi:hypothetical protein GWI33_015805 [Rhynchophorus ferrugineus]|uniref:Secreted protein n=1 Tax=Rhynchophorus ferrugineus TaxID=354439 RepID=A0A834HYH8_RHYFE|nr:hypothetical protein GWI33_015805 [Rhynchophorus ferrugineus]
MQTQYSYNQMTWPLLMKCFLFHCNLCCQAWGPPRRDAGRSPCQLHCHLLQSQKTRRRGGDAGRKKNAMPSAEHSEDGGEKSRQTLEVSWRKFSF